MKALAFALKMIGYSAQKVPVQAFIIARGN
jgi:hypothetical protein